MRRWLCPVEGLARDVTGVTTRGPSPACRRTPDPSDWHVQPEEHARFQERMEETRTTMTYEPVEVEWKKIDPLGLFYDGPWCDLEGWR